MVSSTPSSRSSSTSRRQCFARAIVGAWLLSFAAIVSAQNASVANVVSTRAEATEEGVQLNADFEVQLSPGMIEAVRKGVALHFLVEFELTKGRWYWLDESVAKATRSRRLAYAPLTEQYRITSAGVSQNVASVEEVQRILSRVRSWTVVEKGRLKVGEKYEGQVRIRLDTSQLPKPFQVNALGSKEWSLASDWQRFTLVAEKP